MLVWPYGLCRYYMQMIFASTAFVLVFPNTFISNPACIASSLSSNDELSDVNCLKSIKKSLEDPFHHLNWNFDDLRAGSFCKFAGIECWNDQEIRILSVSLIDMELRGQFPPGIGNCTSIQTLDLSGNQLSGPIPLQVWQNLPYLVALNLSNNAFHGEIPSTLANCIYLNMLSLGYNQLTGQIPRQLGMLTRIKVFDVSNNLLSGPVPNFAHTEHLLERYSNNEGLCGGPLQSCQEKVGRLKFDYSFESGFMAGYVFSAVAITSIFGFYHVCFSYM